jgi:Ca2+-binding RTX toxin-like protein
MSGVFIDLGADNDVAGGAGFNDTILGNVGDDTIAGFSGNDSLLGGSDDDFINGGDGDDTIYGGAGHDLLLAGAGNNDRLFGEGGNDSFLADSTPGSAFGAYFDGGAGDDTFRVYARSDTLIGGNGTDRVEFLSGNQTIDLRAFGSDRASGIDHLVLSGTNQQLIFDYDSVIRLTDAGTLRVSGITGNVINLLGWVQGTSSGGFTSFTLGTSPLPLATVLVADNLLSDVPGETRSGTEGNDSISLGLGSDSYLGLGGSDSVLGNGGNDTIDGGNSGDTIYGGIGDDLILGGNGNDRIFGELGNDSIDAGAGNSDRVLYNHTDGAAINAVIDSSGGSSGVNIATVTTSSQGNDFLRGFELLYGSNAADTFIVNTAATAVENLFVFGGGGNDTLIDNYRVSGVFVDYSSVNLTRGVSVNLTDGQADDGFGGTDSLVGFTAINATAYADTLIGSASNDRIRAQAGSDFIDGRGGSGDILDYSQNSSSQAISVNLLNGVANDGLGGTDTLISIEQVRGGAGNDTIIGDGANNNFRGNAGSDRLDGGGGDFDVVDYSFATAGVSVDLLLGVASDGQGGTDTLANIEFVWGSNSADTLIGGAGNDILRGNAGSDIINGGEGSADIADYRNATAGITVNMATGVVQDGQGGTDALSGIEQIWGSTFNDSMLGGEGNDYFVGSSGADTFVGGNGIDSVNYSFNPSNNTAATQGVSIDLAAGTGRDGYGSAEILQSIEIIYGTSFADTISGGAASETLWGNGGTDSLVGGAGNDRLFGDASDDTLDGGSGDNLLAGGEGNDLYIISGDIASSVIDDMSGQDTVSFGGVQGLDIAANALSRMAGIEAIDLGLGGHTLRLTASAVTALSPDTDVLRVYGGGADRLVFDDASGWTRSSPSGGFVTFTNGSATVIVGESLVPLLPGGPTSGGDTLTGTSGADTIDLLAGNDSYLGLFGNDSIVGGDGADTLNGEFGNDTLFGGNGTDSLFGDSGADSLSGGNGDDRVEGSGLSAIALGSFTLSGDDGNDLVLMRAGFAYVSASLSGGAGNDTINGGDSRDTIYGGDGDVINGGAGDDVILVGGVTLAEIYALFGP